MKRAVLPPFDKSALRVARSAKLAQELTETSILPEAEGVGLTYGTMMISDVLYVTWRTVNVEGSSDPVKRVEGDAQVSAETAQKSSVRRKNDDTMLFSMVVCYNDKFGIVCGCFIVVRGCSERAV